MIEKNNKEFKKELKQLIIQSLKASYVTPDDIDDDEPLFSENCVLALDSIDSLEIIVAIQRKYNVRIDDQNLARSVLFSICTIAEFIQNNNHQTK
jgi:acyl carrier protein